MQPLDLESNQLTVLHLAPFFEELKSDAGQLAASAGASRRGYFSPGEEQATGKLLVSYWHARNALFDLITNLRLHQNLFGRALYGLQKLMGTLVADKYLRLGHQPALPPAVRTAVQGLLLPGDVLAVRKEYALTTYFLPGYWPHVALYLGPAASLRDFDVWQRGAASSVRAGMDGEAADGGLVMESMRDGVHLRALSSPFGSDSLIVLRPKLDAGDVREAIARSFRHHRKPYDFSFDFTRADRLVCTEVVYRSFDGIGSMHLPLVQRMGRPTLSADDLIGMAVCGRAFEPVAVYAPAFADRIITGAETWGLIRRARRTEPTA